MCTPLYRARIATGKTQRVVANDNGIDPGQYSRMERGIDPLTPERAEALSRYFGSAVSEMELLYPERYPAPTEAA